jgi:hypothetical protein
MDHDRFDTLARRVFAGSRRSRRAALAALFGAALLRTESSAVLAKAKAKAASQQPCYPGGKTCTPGRGKNTPGCDFTFSPILRNRDARGANLSNSSFVGADMTGADLRGANLSGGCFIGADLTGAKLGNSVNLHEAIFCNTVMPDGTIDNSDCDRETACCRPRQQDCADAVVSCWLPNEIGGCGAFVNNIGPVGHCWQILSGCCPCDHRDRAYWTEQCNQKFPACNGKCIAQDEENFLACFTCP